MISENIDRDLVKSQLKEGLKHSRKVLKDKRGRKNRELVFTVGDCQFLVNRWDTRYKGTRGALHLPPFCFFTSDAEDRGEEIATYLDDEICDSRKGIQDLSLYLVGDMRMCRQRTETQRTEAWRNRYEGISLPFVCANGRGEDFRLKHLDALIFDAPLGDYEGYLVNEGSESVGSATSLLDILTEKVWVELMVQKTPWNVLTYPPRATLENLFAISP